MYKFSHDIYESDLLFELIFCIVFRSGVGSDMGSKEGFDVYGMCCPRSISRGGALAWNVALLNYLCHLKSCIANSIVV